MDEGHPLAEGSYPRFVIYQVKPFVIQSLELHPDVVDLVGHVVEARAFLLQEFVDGAFFFKWFEKFYLLIAGLDKADPDALFRHFLIVKTTMAEQSLVHGFRFFNGKCGYSEMIDFHASKLDNLCGKVKTSLHLQKIEKMKFWTIALCFMTLIACQSEEKKAQDKAAAEKTGEKDAEPLPEGMRNKRGYPIGTVEQAQQLLAGAKAKRREIARRNKAMIEDTKYGELIRSTSEKMDIIRPRMERLDSLTQKIVAGERVDFLSDEDMGKIQYRQQTLLDAMIDSLSHLNSQIDVVLSETDVLVMEQK